MTVQPAQYVVDASVGIKLFVTEPLSDHAHALFSRLQEDPAAILYVPDLFFIECSNILWKYTRRYGRAIEDSLADLADLRRLALRVVSTAGLMEDALALAIQTGLTAYDACYAVLARRMELPLVSADAPLCAAISWAVWLGDLNQGEREGSV